MKKLTHRKKIISIFLILILVGVMSSGLFADSHGHFYFSPLTNQAPYYSGSYENYTISGGPLVLSNNNTRGYLNVSSFSSITTLDTHMVIYNLSEPVYINRTVNISRNNGKFCYNGSKVMLPFFYTNHVISSYRNHYINASKSDICTSMITQQGIYQFHIGKYIGGNGDGECDIFSGGSQQLVRMEGVDPVIYSILGAHVQDGNKSYPVGLILTLHSTSYVVFPVNWMYVIAVYVVVAFSVGYIIIVPAAIVLGILAYRKKKRVKK